MIRSTLCTANTSTNIPTIMTMCIRIPTSTGMATRSTPTSIHIRTLTNININTPTAMNTRKGDRNTTTRTVQSMGLTITCTNHTNGRVISININ